VYLCKKRDAKQQGVVSEGGVIASLLGDLPDLEKAAAVSLEQISKELKELADKCAQVTALSLAVFDPAFLPEGQVAVALEKTGEALGRQEENLSTTETSFQDLLRYFGYNESYVLTASSKTFLSLLHQFVLALKQNAAEHKSRGQRISGLTLAGEDPMSGLLAAIRAGNSL